MNDYISRDAAKEKCCSLCRWEGTDNCSECEHPIDDIPAADVRPVVLCRDCILRQYCKVAQYLGADGFCSKGEKREES